MLMSHKVLDYLFATDDAEKIESDGTDLTVNSGGKINLTATSDVHLPPNVGLVFGDGEKIEGNDTDLTVTSGADITLAATGDVNLPNNVGLVFGDDGEKIEGDGTDLTIAASATMNLNAPTSVVASTPLFEIKDTTNSANASTLKFVKDKGAAAADNDDVGTILFVGDNAAQEQTNFGKILCEVSRQMIQMKPGKLSLLVAASDGTTSALVLGLVRRRTLNKWRSRCNYRCRI